jgi:steroid 5-alpha reductase family enzyme
MDDFPLGAFLGALPLTLLTVVVVLGGTFLVALRLGRHAVVDVAWGLGFAGRPTPTACVVPAGSFRSAQP